MGAIEAEASPWLEDNQWVLDVMAKVMVGTIGDIDPGTPDFRKNLERFHRNELFLGIRCGNLWDRNFGKQVTRPAFIADLKVLAAAGLTLDTANQDAEVIAAGPKPRIENRFLCSSSNSNPLQLTGSFTLQAWIYPTTSQKGVQGILTKWSPLADTGYGLFIDEDGSLGVQQASNAP